MLFAAIILRVCTLEVGTPKIAFAENPLMTLSVTNFEVGISYRDVQWHAPIGTITNPCSQADFFLRASIGEMEPASISPKPIFASGNSPGKTKFSLWTMAFIFFGTTRIPLRGAGRMLRGQRSRSTAWAKLPEIGSCERNHGQRICQNSGESGGIPQERKESEPSGRASECGPGDYSGCAGAAFRHVGETGGAPGRNFNSLPPYYRVSPQQTQETIRNLEVRKPAATTTLTVIASTVGRRKRMSFDHSVRQLVRG